MGLALVALTSDEHDDDLLAAAKEYATGTETELLVCRFVDEEQYRSNLERGAKSGKSSPSVNEIEESAQTEAAEIAETAFSDDVPYRVLGILGDLPDDILRVANEHDCAHVFITGRKRSPTGKVLFGDIAQSVILNFDGPITVTTN